MDRFYYEFGDFHMMVIDGFVDLIWCVNDEKCSLMLIEEFFRIGVIYNTSFVFIIHIANTGMKLRGHLGSLV